MTGCRWKTWLLDCTSNILKSVVCFPASKLLLTPQTAKPTNCWCKLLWRSACSCYGDCVLIVVNFVYRLASFAMSSFMLTAWCICTVRWRYVLDFMHLNDLSKSALRCLVVALIFDCQRAPSLPIHGPVSSIASVNILLKIYCVISWT